MLRTYLVSFCSYVSRSGDLCTCTRFEIWRFALFCITCDETNGTRRTSEYESWQDLQLRNLNVPHSTSSDLRVSSTIWDPLLKPLNQRRCAGSVARPCVSRLVIVPHSAAVPRSLKVILATGHGRVPVSRSVPDPYIIVRDGSGRN